MRGPFRLITDEQARSFNERGFFVLENAIDPAAIVRVRDAIDPFEAKAEEFLRSRPDGRMGIAQADGITFTVHLVRLSSVLREFSASRTFQDLCHDLIGPDVRLYWDQAVYKKPEYPKPFPWHQDNGYTYVEPQAYLTCWVALNDATLDNGCPWVIPGGHLRGTLAHRLSKLGYVCREEDGPEALAVPVREGSVVVFSSLMPHRTGPNVTRGRSQVVHPAVRARRRARRADRHCLRRARSPVPDSKRWRPRFSAAASVTATASYRKENPEWPRSLQPAFPAASNAPNP